MLGGCDTLVLKCGDKLAALADRAGDFEDWITAAMGRAAGRVSVVAGHRGAPLPAPGTVGRVVVTGSAAMLTDHAGWSEACARWLREAVDAGLPVLGICFGHQLLAHALGGTVGDNPHGLEVGSVALDRQVAGDPLLGSLPARFSANMSHRQAVLQLPPGALQLASSARDPHAAFVCSPRAWGVQFHPEFDGAVTAAHIEHYRAQGLLGDAEARDLQAACRDTPASRGVLARFAQLERW
ncbi:MAG TPA: glutamine amidotransferase [Gammaproteobacteria bacterium]